MGKGRKVVPIYDTDGSLLNEQHHQLHTDMLLYTNFNTIDIEKAYSSQTYPYYKTQDGTYHVYRGEKLSTLLPEKNRLAQWALVMPMKMAYRLKHPTTNKSESLFESAMLLPVGEDSVAANYGWTIVEDGFKTSFENIKAYDLGCYGVGGKKIRALYSGSYSDLETYSESIGYCYNGMESGNKSYALGAVAKPTLIFDRLNHMGEGSAKTERMLYKTLSPNEREFSYSSCDPFDIWLSNSSKLGGYMRDDSIVYGQFTQKKGMRFDIVDTTWTTTVQDWYRYTKWKIYNIGSGNSEKPDVITIGLSPFIFPKYSHKEDVTISHTWLAGDGSTMEETPKFFGKIIKTQNDGAISASQNGSWDSKDYYWRYKYPYFRYTQWYPVYPVTSHVYYQFLYGEQSVDTYKAIIKGDGLTNKKTDLVSRYNLSASPKGISHTFWAHVNHRGDLCWNREIRWAINGTAYSSKSGESSSTIAVFAIVNGWEFQTGNSSEDRYKFPAYWNSGNFNRDKTYPADVNMKTKTTVTKENNNNCPVAVVRWDAEYLEDSGYTFTYSTDDTLSIATITINNNTSYIKLYEVFLCSKLMILKFSI